MRNDLIAYLRTQSATLGTVAVSDELPWSKDGSPLYLKNFKRIYVDREQTAQEPLINTLQGASFVSSVTTVRAYLVVDAKNTLTNLDSIVNLMLAAHTSVNPETRLDRTVRVDQITEADALISTFTYEFRRVILN